MHGVDLNIIAKNTLKGINNLISNNIFKFSYHNDIVRITDTVTAIIENTLITAISWIVFLPIFYKHDNSFSITEYFNYSLKCVELGSMGDQLPYINKKYEKEIITIATIIHVMSIITFGFNKVNYIDKVLSINYNDEYNYDEELYIKSILENTLAVLLYYYEKKISNYNSDLEVDKYKIGDIIISYKKPCIMIDLSKIC